jgi:hypothetical protein
MAIYMLDRHSPAARGCCRMVMPASAILLVQMHHPALEEVVVYLKKKLKLVLFLNFYPSSSSAS